MLCIIDSGELQTRLHADAFTLCDIFLGLLLILLQFLPAILVEALSEAEHELEHVLIELLIDLLADLSEVHSHDLVT